MKQLKREPKLKIRKRTIKKLKWGIAGCGHFTETTFLPALHMVKRSKLVSVYSSDLIRANYIANKFNAEKGYNEFQEFLKSDFEVLYVASKNSDHHWQVIEAAKAGKHILCEKPLALNFQQAAEMVKICEENNIYLAVNYVHRFHPLVLKAKELLSKNMLGKIVSISASFNIDFTPNDNFRFKKELSGGGALRDLGTHMIDLLRFFGGEINDITGYVDNVVYKSEVEDYASAVVKFEKSGYGYFNASFNCQKAFNRIEILGYKGCLSIDNFIGKKLASSKLTIDLPGEGKKAFRKRANKMIHLLRSVQKSLLKKEPPLVSGYDGLVNMKLMEELENKCR